MPAATQPYTERALYISTDFSQIALNDTVMLACWPPFFKTTVLVSLIWLDLPAFDYHRAISAFLFEHRTHFGICTQYARGHICAASDFPDPGKKRSCRILATMKSPMWKFGLQAAKHTDLGWTDRGEKPCRVRRCLEGLTGPNSN